jgi:RsmE family RNA methyltransferase
MNRLLLAEADRTHGDAFEVHDHRARHVAEVLGAEPGRVLRVGLVDVGPGWGTVLESAPDRLRLRVTLEGDEPPATQQLVLAIPRPKFLRRILPQVASFGLRSLDLVRAWKTERPYLQSPLLTEAGWSPLVLEGMMQGGTTRMPRIAVHRRFEAFVEHFESESEAGDRWLAVPGARDHPLSLDSGGPTLTWAVGPEGGFTAYERDRLQAARFHPVTLARNVLRTDVACVAALTLGEAVSRLRGMRC